MSVHTLFQLGNLVFAVIKSASPPASRAMERDMVVNGTHVSSLRGFVSSSLCYLVSLLLQEHESREGFSLDLGVGHRVCGEVVSYV